MNFFVENEKVYLVDTIHHQIYTQIESFNQANLFFLQSLNPEQLRIKLLKNLEIYAIYLDAQNKIDDAFGILQYIASQESNNPEFLTTYHILSLYYCSREIVDGSEEMLKIIDELISLPVESNKATTSDADDKLEKEFPIIFSNSNEEIFIVAKEQIDSKIDKENLMSEIEKLGSEIALHAKQIENLVSHHQASNLCQNDFDFSAATFPGDPLNNMNSLYDAPLHLRAYFQYREANVALSENSFPNNQDKISESNEYDFGTFEPVKKKRKRD